MEEKEKILIKLRLAATLRKIFEQNKKTKNDSVTLVKNVRQLEAASGLSFNIVQGVYSARRDIQLTSLITLVEEGLEMKFSDFVKMFDAISVEEIKEVKKDIAMAKKSRE
jgi:hypothetical protein